MSLRNSSAALTGMELSTLRAASTGTSHTLTVKVNVAAQPATLSISQRSLPIENGDAVTWRFVTNQPGNPPFEDPGVKVVFENLPHSMPGDPEDSRISVDVSEVEASEGTKYVAKYSVLLNGVRLESVLPLDGPQLVIDKMCAPPPRGPRRLWNWFSR
ncbi:MAG TPA: hypothetical protein VIA62_06775 [Thermoanaerobaculia bacterium]|jgi:hypothetical protein|nr:hypothetical protein [Thermoanaerobaculia bacterium]